MGRVPAAEAEAVADGGDHLDDVFGLADEAGSYWREQAKPAHATSDSLSADVQVRAVRTDTPLRGVVKTLRPSVPDRRLQRDSTCLLDPICAVFADF